MSKKKYTLKEVIMILVIVGIITGALLALNTDVEFRNVEVFNNPPGCVPFGTGTVNSTSCVVMEQIEDSTKCFVTGQVEITPLGVMRTFSIMADSNNICQSDSI